MNYGLSLITPPTAEPVSLKEAKVQCGVPEDNHHFDDALQRAIESARLKAEADTGRVIVEQTWELTLDRFGDPIELPLWPVSSVTELRYLDVNGDEQTLSTDVYMVLANRQPAEIRLKRDQSWPELYGQAGNVTVEFVAGTSPSSVPAGLKSAMLLLVHHEFDPAQTGDIERAYRSMITTYLTGDEFATYAR